MGKKNFKNCSPNYDTVRTPCENMIYLIHELIGSFLSKAFDTTIIVPMMGNRNLNELDTYSVSKNGGNFFFHPT